MIKICVILGPTASGKTSLSLELAKKYNGEIVSADSRQIYREMDIGSAKVSGVWKGGVLFVDEVAHHMIDIVQPDTPYSLAQYQRGAVACLQEIALRGKLPFLVGGTGLYIASIVDNYVIPQGSPDNSLRASLDSMNNEQLLAKLKILSPQTAQKIDVKNKRRLVRALEVAMKTGKEFVTLRQKAEPIFDTLQIGVSVDRAELVKRIDVRVDEMVETGLENEVRELMKKYSVDLPSMSGIGYRQMAQYINGEISLDDAIALIKRDTRRYAKRQMTWFKRDKRIHWVSKAVEASVLIDEFVNHK